MAEAAASLLALRAIQALLSVFESTMSFGAYLCPLSPPIETITSISAFDYIIIGGGTAGSVLANRLSECSDKTVLVLEAGGCPPLEAHLLGYFGLLTLSKYDYNITTVNDGYSCQNLQGGVMEMTAGKMLGGTSCIHHGMFVRGSKSDYDEWVTAANDSSWSYDDLLEYFIKIENVLDEVIVQENPEYHGTSGPTKVNRQISAENVNIMDAFVEQGYRKINDLNANVSTGVIEPLYQVGDKLRQSGLTSYIYPVKDRPNLYVLTDATVTKINFDSDKVATGVQFTYSGTTYTVNATNEVILSAGTIKSPQLLMISGIGPSDHLTSLDIPVVVDQPYVGQNLIDHVVACMFFGLDYDNSTTAAVSPFDFPAPVTIHTANLDDFYGDSAQYQSVNMVFPHDSTTLMQTCLNVVKMSIPMCQKIYDANIGRRMWQTVSYKLHPSSRGCIRCNTTDISDPPLVDLGLLSDDEDLVDLASFLAFTANITDTTYFKSIGAEFIDLGLCTEYTKYSTEYWQCYTLAMSTGAWHYCGTCAMGTVTDARLRVNGVSNLRVVDASIFPNTVGGKLIVAVMATAEKAANMIKSDGGLTCSD